jgi:hypothetical protein
METPEKVNKTMDFISRDRLMADDPYFSARLMAKVEHQFSRRDHAGGYSPLFAALRPVMAVAVIVIGIFAGIFLGKQLENGPAVGQETEHSIRLRQFVRAEFITEINGSVEEQILLNK